MIIVYHCYGSAHSSVIASALHVGLLPTDRVPKLKEILALKYFDKTESKDIGTPLYMGNDLWNNPVYAVGMTYKKEVVKRAIYSLLDMYHLPHDQILCSNALSSAHLFTKIGGILSRRYGLIKVGRPLTALGMQLKYYKFIELVKSVQKREEELMLNKLDGINKVIDNKGRISSDWGEWSVIKSGAGNRKS
ncbi:MAG TPA: DUF3189 family protein [Clostridia bacterium]|jgi:hypothetical protein|nr:DUF3189 family protein [Clostridia bacterium]